MISSISTIQASDSLFVLEEVGHIPVNGYANGIQVKEDYLYLFDFTEGLFAYDISDLSNPSLIDSYAGSNPFDYRVKGGKKLYIKDNYIIAGFMGAGLKIFNISDPTTLELVGEIFDGEIYHIEVVGNYVYQAMSEYGFQIIDITDVTNPIKVGEYTNGNCLYHIHVIGNYAFLRDYGQEKTLCLNCSDFSDIQVVAEFDWAAYTIAMSGDVGFLCKISGGILAYNFSDPTEPILIGEFYDGGESSDITIRGNLAFVADAEDGLEILNITDPANIVEIAQFNDGERARDICVKDNLAFISEYEDGVEIVKLWEENESPINTTATANNSNNSSPGFELTLSCIGILVLVNKKRKSHQ